MIKSTLQKKSRQRKVKLIVTILLLIVIICLLESGRFLVISQSPKQVDVIIVLSGGPGRIERATELYNDGYTMNMILSNSEENISASGNMFQTAISLGIPKEIITVENIAQSTYQNAEFTLTIMKEKSFRSAIVVSSDFHMRRVKILFDSIYRDTGIKLTYVSANSGYNAKRWWSDHYSRETTFNEYTKMIGNALGYYGPEAKEILDRIKRWFR
ncbi:YdcF family protein [Paenibacillus sp. NPDC058367]|uniref:YdcF family protein n=1 Tax=Paenibacillus sp. NPDC058367 TaxID=3346460 RepID=UPI00364FE484